MKIVEIYGDVVYLEPIDTSERKSDGGIVYRVSDCEDNLAKVIMAKDENLIGSIVIYNDGSARYRNKEKNIILIDAKNILAKVSITEEKANDQGQES